MTRTRYASTTKSGQMIATALQPTPTGGLFDAPQDTPCKAHTAPETLIQIEMTPPPTAPNCWGEQVKQTRFIVYGPNGIMRAAQSEMRVAQHYRTRNCPFWEADKPEPPIGESRYIVIRKD